MSNTPSPTVSMRQIRNFTPATFITGQLAGQKRRRLRTAVSCDPCRKRKTKCDQGQPCGTCTARLRQSECIFGGDLEAHANSNAAEDVPIHPPESALPALPGAALPGRHDKGGRSENRMVFLEQRVEELQGMVASLVSGAKAGMIPPLQKRDPDEADDNTVEDSHATGPEIASGNLLGFRNGLLSSKNGILHYIGPTGWTLAYHQEPEIVNIFQHGKELEPQWRSYLQIRNRFQGWRISSLLDSVAVPSVPQLTGFDLISLIPERPVCDVLVRRFLMSFNKFYLLVDEKDFLKEISGFWNSEAQTPNNWVAFYITVLATGFLLPVYPFPDGHQVKRSRAHGARMLRSVMQFLLSSASRFRRPDTKLFQAMLLSALARKLELHEPDGSVAMNGLLAIIRQMAFAMGLHRDPSIARKSSRIPAKERESRRKLWIIYVLIDLEYALQSGMPFLLRPVDFTTLAPADCEDTEEIAYLRCVYNGIPLWAEILQAANTCNDGLPYRRIDQFQRRLNKLTTLIDEQLEEVRAQSDAAPEVALVRGLRKSFLYCLNTRMTVILHTALAADAELKSERDATLVASVSTLEYAEMLVGLIEACPQDSQDSWTHFLIALFSCQFGHASVHILVRIRRTLEAVDFPLPKSCTTKHKIWNFTLSTLLDFVEGSTISFHRVVHHSPSAVKASLFHKTFHAEIKERIRLAEGNGASHGEEPHGWRRPFEKDKALESILYAMRRAMDESLDMSLRAVSQAEKNLDPPAMLCAEAAGENKAVDNHLDIRDEQGSNGQMATDSDLAYVPQGTAQDDLNLNLFLLPGTQDQRFDDDWSMASVWPFDTDW